MINVTYHDPIHGQLHVVVSMPYGGGSNSYTVLINDYYQGQIVRTSQGWRSYIQTNLLTPDDLDAILKAHP